MRFEPTGLIWPDAVPVELVETLWGTTTEENYLTE